MNKVLLVRVGRVGDIVMITAAINAALDLYPDSEIHILTSPDGKRVLKNYHQRLTKVIVYDRTKLFSYFHRKKIAKKIKTQKYSNIYCFEVNPSYMKLFDSELSGIYVMDHYDEGDNYARQCMRLVADSFPDKEGYNQWISLSVDSDKEMLARNILKEQGITDDDFVIALHPSFSGLRKNPLRSQVARQQRGWPPECFAELARKYSAYAEQNHFSIKVIVDLLEEEAELGKQVVDLSGGVVKLFTPAMDFERYKGTLHRANLVITPNTGPMHVAAALGTPVIALFAGLLPQNSGAYVPDPQFTAICAEDMPNPELGLSAIPAQAVFEASIPYLPKV